jgi:hypothetical protein
MRHHRHQEGADSQHRQAQLHACGNHQQRKERLYIIKQTIFLVSKRVSSSEQGVYKKIHPTNQEQEQEKREQNSTKLEILRKALVATHS